MRVIRTLRAMGIRSVAVYSDADAGARHVAEADVAVRIGPPPARQSYLDIEAVVEAAAADRRASRPPRVRIPLGELRFRRGAASAPGGVHRSARGGRSSTMGDKIARQGARCPPSGFRSFPASPEPGLSDADLIAAADDIGFPSWSSRPPAAAARACEGRRRRRSPAALASARRESAAAFGDDTLFLERFVLRPRHIEVQVLADGYGTVLHFGERECSLQRRHQKVIEEAPSPLLDAATRARIGAAAVRHRPQRRLRRCGHRRVHRVRRPARRVLLHGDEHPAAGRASGHRDWSPVGTSSSGRCASRRGRSCPSARTTSRCAGTRSRPASTPRTRRPASCRPAGRCSACVEPMRPGGSRVDSGLSAGMTIGSDYDPMLAKVIAHGAGPRDGVAAAGPGAVRDRRARRRHQRRVPAVPAG